MNDITSGCGVPQGSMLGLLLFLFYINDVPRTTPIFKYVFFAGNTNVFYSGDRQC